VAHNYVINIYIERNRDLFLPTMWPRKEVKHGSLHKT